MWPFTNIESSGPTRDGGPKPGLLAILDFVFVRGTEFIRHRQPFYCLVFVYRSPFDVNRSRTLASHKYLSNNLSILELIPNKVLVVRLLLKDLLPFDKHY